MKDLKISKELVSEVFKLNISEAYIENNNLYFDMGLPLIQNINLYEFAYKCKEWAFARNYSLMSREAREYDLCSPSIYKQVGLCNILVNDNPNVSKGIFVDSTEVEAIIKASEWILSEVNK